MADFIGLDIGGANTKAAFISTNRGYLKELKVKIEYFPIWKNPEKLVNTLHKFREFLSNVKIGGVGVTMTAELSDAYQTKRAGVNHILACVAKVFSDMPVFVLDVDATLWSLPDAILEPLKVASANWAGTGWLVSQLVKNCVVIDVGSTSTSIIPVVGGQVAGAGKTDLEKLVNGELVYTGTLRTNIATIVTAIPTKEGSARVSSELFAQSGDIHLILGNIKPEEYTVETADGRGKTRFEAMARLARVVCADTDMLSEQELFHMAEYIYNSQIEQVANGLRQVLARTKSATNEKVIAVVTGIGKEFIARRAAERVGFNGIVDLEDLVQNPLVARASPAVGVALLTAKKLEGETIQWTQLSK